MGTQFISVSKPHIKKIHRPYGSHISQLNRKDNFRNYDKRLAPIDGNSNYFLRSKELKSVSTVIRVHCDSKNNWKQFKQPSIQENSEMNYNASCKGILPAVKKNKVCLYKLAQKDFLFLLLCEKIRCRTISSV